MVQRKSKRYGLRSSNTLKYFAHDAPGTYYYYGVRKPSQSLVGENLSLSSTVTKNKYDVEKTWNTENFALSMNKNKRWELPDAILEDDKEKLAKFAYELDQLGWNNLQHSRVPVQQIITELDFTYKDKKLIDSKSVFRQSYKFVDYEADSESEKESDDEKPVVREVVKQQKIIRIEHYTLRGEKQTIKDRKAKAAHLGQPINKKNENVKRRKKRNKEEYYRVGTKDGWVDYCARDKTHPQYERHDGEVSPGWSCGGDASSKSYYKIKGRKNKETKRYYDNYVDPMHVQKL